MLSGQQGISATARIVAASLVIGGLMSHAATAQPGELDAKGVKQKLLTLAQSYAGQGDPDRAKQRSLTTLVEKLVALSPQPPVQQRLPLIRGAWKQVWGPYDYRNNRRGVDPTIGVDEIYQVVFDKGFYYNVSPSFKNGDRQNEQITLLRGEYKLDPKVDTLLRVRFTNLYSVKTRPSNPGLWELPPLAESGSLAGRKRPLPGFVVKLLFGGGALREVYTDDDLRITYGSDGKDLTDDFIYVLTRMRN